MKTRIHIFSVSLLLCALLSHTPTSLPDTDTSFPHMYIEAYGKNIGKKERSRQEAESISRFIRKYDDKKKDKKSNSPYATCRIVVQGQENELENYDAVDTLHCPEYEEYILQYENETQTKKAYQALKKKYGKRCYVDQVITSDALQENGESSLQITSGLLSDSMSSNIAPSDSMSETPDNSSSVEKDTGMITWGYGYMGFDYAEDYLLHHFPDSNSTIAIIDTGCDMDNWYFTKLRSQENVASGARPLFSPDSYDFVENDSTPQDESSNGHGTHVAGIAGACIPEQTSLMILKVFTASGYSSVLYIDTALKYAVAHDADVINMSLGKRIENGFTENCWDEAIESAYDHDVIICCASGNSGDKGDTVDNCYPAFHSKTIAVGSIDEDENCSTFSCKGDKITFCAPGRNIISAKKEAAPGEVKTDKGTSMACPHVAAAMAYLKIGYPTAHWQELYQKAVELAYDLGEKGKDTTYGYGCIRFSSQNFTPEGATATPPETTTASKPETTTASKPSTTTASKPETTTADKSETTTASKPATTTTSKAATVSTKTSVKITVYAPQKIKVKKSSSRSRTLTWKKRGSCSGYQIQYSTYKSFKKNVKMKTIKSSKTTKVKIRSLKKRKTYYFRMREYYRYKGKNYYSKWSKRYKK